MRMRESCIQNRQMEGYCGKALLRFSTAQILEFIQIKAFWTSGIFPAVKWVLQPRPPQIGEIPATNRVPAKGRKPKTGQRTSYILVRTPTTIQGFPCHIQKNHQDKMQPIACWLVIYRLQASMSRAPASVFSYSNSFPWVTGNLLDRTSDRNDISPDERI